MTETPPQTPPRSARPGRRWLLPAALATAVVLGAVAFGAYLAGSGEPDTVTLQTAGASQPTTASSPSPSPTASVILPYLQARVTAVFADTATGKRVELTVLEVKSPDPKCATHELRPSGAFQPFVGVYYTGCTDWEQVGVHIALFAVRLRNRTDTSVGWNRTDFTIVDRKGKHHVTVDVRAKAKDASSLLASKGRIVAHGTVDGLIAFTYRGDWSPGELIYRDGSQRLLIELAGPIRRTGHS